MFVFRKIWCALFSCYIRFEIRPFALTPAPYGCNEFFWLPNRSAESFVLRMVDVVSCPIDWQS